MDCIFIIAHRGNEEMRQPPTQRRRGRGGSQRKVESFLRDSLRPLRLCVGGCLFVFIESLSAQPCKDTVYLTLDTGNMRHAELIADILKRQQVKATFFLANEKTPQGDYSLDARWVPYWKARVSEGHAFGSHTWDHGVFSRDLPQGKVHYRPLFGVQAGKTLVFDAAAVCAELDRVNRRFEQMTGRELDGYWRAPGGHTTPNTLSAAKTCGYQHVGWSATGFLGDELPSEKFSNQALLQKALREIKAGDILLAHLGIWSRKEPYAPTLEPLIAGLKQRGFCFATLRGHPDYR